MAGIISRPGIGSGLDIGSIVSALVQSEGAPKTAQLDRRQGLLQTELSALGLLKGALSEFRSSLSNLLEADQFTSRSASSSDNDIASISINDGANPSAGSYHLTVQQLANAHKLISAGVSNSADVGAGVITFTQFGSDKLPPSDAGNSSDGDSFSIDTSDLARYDTDEDGQVSLEELKNAINAADDNPGINATIINVDDGAGGTVQKLVFASAETGLENAFEVTTSGFTELGVTNLSDPNDPNYAKDAVIEIDGQTVTGSSNSFDNAIDGLTITAKESNVGETITLSVSANTGVVKGRIENFVKAYNALQDVFTEHSQFNVDRGTSSALFADSMLRSLRGQMRSGATGLVGSSDSSFNSLSALGITTDTSGKLSIDSTKLNDALKDDFDGVVKLFSNEDGIAQRLDAQMDNYLKSAGTFDSRTDSLNDRLRDIDDERETLSLRLERVEARLLSQFNAMDAMIAQLNSTSSWLSSQLENLPGVVRQSNN